MHDSKSVLATMVAREKKLRVRQLKCDPKISGTFEGKWKHSLRYMGLVLTTASKKKHRRVKNGAERV